MGENLVGKIGAGHPSAAAGPLTSPGGPVIVRRGFNQGGAHAADETFECPRRSPGSDGNHRQGKSCGQVSEQTVPLVVFFGTEI